MLVERALSGFTLTSKQTVLIDHGILLGQLRETFHTTLAARTVTQFPTDTLKLTAKHRSFGHPSGRTLFDMVRNRRYIFSSSTFHLKGFYIV